VVPPPLAPPLLELQGVEKSFPGQAKPILTQISVTVPEGQFAAIVGCSGAGKTTLISLLVDDRAPNRGEIRFAGNLWMHRPGTVVFQNYSPCRG
jgi:ABC-type nitrate/sulfonate/bicarbonate transport system ATPase subunit